MSSKFTVLINRVTKNVLVLDNWRVRYNRMRKRISDWVNTLDAVSRSDYQFVMIRLSYAPGQEWEPNHVRAFMLSVKKILGSDLLGYAWVAELQKRGAVHYHVLLFVPKMLQLGYDIPYPDEAGLWLWGSTRVEVARSPFYLITYLGKEYQKDFSKFPKGIRVFAVYIREGALKLALRYLALKKFQQAIVDEFGWSDLPGMTALRKRLLEGDGYFGWELWGFARDKDEAVSQGEGWSEMGYSWRGRSIIEGSKA